MSLALRQRRINGNEFVYKHRQLGLLVYALPPTEVKVKVKVKVKFTLEQATKAQRGSRGISLLFLQPRR
jgi:hypothetical protein